MVRGQESLSHRGILVCWCSFNALIPPPRVVRAGLPVPEPGPFLANTPGCDPFVTSHRVSKEEGSWTGAALCSCELCWPLLEYLNCYGGAPRNRKSQVEDKAAEAGSPSIQLAAKPGSEASACLSWRDEWEVLEFISLRSFSIGPLGTEEHQGEGGGKEEEEGDAHQLLAF